METAMARRFDTIKVGDQLCERRGSEHLYHRLPASFFLVTDLWFDPVRGQYRHASGEMVAIQRIGWDGSPRGPKYAHTIRGLAQAGYQIAEMDFQTLALLRVEAMREGTVIGISAGHRLRKQRAGLPRPKLL